MLALPALLAIVAVLGCASRPPAPPLDRPGTPWGAIDGAPAAAPVPATGARPAVLVLSGGGSRGAFGAGLLCGWTDAGTRPRFDVVTGVSVGSLIAPFAFLGPAYDPVLRDAFTDVGDRDLYRDQALFDKFGRLSLYNVEPMRELLASLLTDEVLDEIAVEHHAGRRLYAGTADLDRHAFVIWDLGAIAARDRPDRRERFHDVLIAAAAIPLLFPPVYFDVEVDGEPYAQMHVDGGILETVFLRSWMLDGLDRPAVHVVMNDRLDPGADAEAVAPRIASLLRETTFSLYGAVRLASAQRVYWQTRDRGLDFRIVSIPEDHTPLPEPDEFRRDEMRPLFDRGEAIGRADDGWRPAPPGVSDSRP